MSLGYKYKSYSETVTLESYEERTHYRNLISFLVRAWREIKERFLINCDDLKLLGLFDPDVILKINNRLFHFSKLLQRFGYINDEATNIKIENEFSSFNLDQERIEKIVSSLEKKFKDDLEY